MVVGFTRVRRVHLGAPGESFGFDGFIHASSVRWLGSFGFVGFSRALHGSRWVNWSRPWKSLCSFGRALWSEDSYGFVGFIRARSGGSRLHLGSLWPFGRVLGVVGFIGVGWVHLEAPLVSSGSFAFFGFIRARHGRQGVNTDSLGLFGCALGVVVFIRVCSVH